MPPSDIEKRLADVELQLQEFRRLRPIADPAPDEWWRFFPRWPKFPFPWPNPVVDPVPDPWNTGGFGGLGGLEAGAAARRSGGIFGPNVDPSPIDFSRFTEIQLRGVKDMITLERKRLEALDVMIDEKLAGLKR